MTTTLRYAEGPTAEADVVIAAPAAEIWPLIVDICLPARFSSEFQGADWLDDVGGDVAGGAAGENGTGGGGGMGGGGEPVVGRRFVGRNEHPERGRWETVSTVVVCDEPRAFGWVVGDLTNPTATWRFELERVEGGTLLRLSARIGPGESGLSPVLAALPDKEERIVARRLKELRTNMAATVRGIRALAERPPALT